jgi:hypothetical protein
MSAALKEVILLTASYYQRTLSAGVLSMYVEDLEDLPTGEVITAYKTYRRNPKNVHFPLPAQIRGLVRPEVDAESAAREIAARITAAIPKYSWYNGPGAREYVGERGCGIIERQGGWAYLCEHHGLTIDPTAFQAQVREQAKADLKYSPESMAKAIGLAPGIRPGIQSIGEIMGANLTERV